MAQNIVSIDGEPTAVMQEEGTYAEEHSAVEPDHTHFEEEYAEEEAPAPARWPAVLAATVALAAIAGWTAFFGWAHYPLLAGSAPMQWAEWAAQWAIPVVLVVALRLLAQRNSRREAHRFGATAQALAAESAALEERLTRTNRELSVAREFLAAQGRDLEALGRMAGDRLSAHADRIAGLVGTNHEQLDAIERISTNALANMETLRGDLPVIANSMRDVTSRIGQAGDEASERLDALVAGFERLNEFGMASERQVDALGESVERIASAGEARFAAITEQDEAFRQSLETREIEALAAIRRRADALGRELAAADETLSASEDERTRALATRIETLRAEHEQLDALLKDGEERAGAALAESTARMGDEIVAVIARLEHLDRQALEESRRRVAKLFEEGEAFDRRLAERNATFADETAQRAAAADAREEEALARLEVRFAALDAGLDERRTALVAQEDAMDARAAELAERIAELEDRMARIATEGGSSADRLAERVAGLSGALDANRETLGETRVTVDELTDASVRLLELVQAGAQHSKGPLGEAIDDAEARLGKVLERFAGLESALVRAGTSGDVLTNRIETARETADAAMREMDEARGMLAERQEEDRQRLAALRDGLAELSDAADGLSTRTVDDIAPAVALLEERLRGVLTGLETDTHAAVAGMAEQVGKESGEAVRRAITAEAKDAIAELEEAARRAGNDGRESAVQLRDQLAKVDELAANLEARVARAREQAEEQVSNDFSRRTALIAESLNSNAIDIASALSNEVSDTAWASYLRGDRGIFTRRAVKLLDSGDARDVLDLYGQDVEFRDHVNRYIHDFEAMLRVLLSTRDGEALSVTMLGSDMGKLYVALAQATERLRD